MNVIDRGERVVVTTSARLHLGFLDLNGEVGRRFGSLGLSLNAPVTQLEVSLDSGETASAQQRALTPEQAYVNQAKQKLMSFLDVDAPVSIKLLHQMPRHSGLGSGTQMALAIGVAISHLFKSTLTLAQIASLVGRGSRSGIGIGTFAHGGIVLDGGRAAHTSIPPIVARHDFPKDWRILLMFELSHVGVHGEAELRAFATLKNQDLARTQAVSHQVLMQGIPAVVEADLKAFGQAVAALQAYTGDYFSPVQGGRYASEKIARVVDYLNTEGFFAVGQSSWGPTGFAIFENEEIAQFYRQRIQERFSFSSDSMMVCQPNNAGAIVDKKRM